MKTAPFRPVETKHMKIKPIVTALVLLWCGFFVVNLTSRVVVRH